MFSRGTLATDLYCFRIDRVVVISPSTEPAAGIVKSRWQIQ
jgi:hypothetical protein